MIRGDWSNDKEKDTKKEEGKGVARTDLKENCGIGD